jgi:apoptosis-inducing factor 2
MTGVGRAASVVVVGGGYGGIVAAQALDPIADVALIDAKDAFFHAVAALRATVDPAWTQRVFMPYDRLLDRCRIVHDRAVSVESGSVTLAGGETIEADYIVLATGSTYPFPAKVEFSDTSDAVRRLTAVRTDLSAAERVLLVGAGPVGMEFAGEITDAWPQKKVILLDSAPDLLGGPYDARMRSSLRRQLVARNVELILGAKLRANPPSAPGTLNPFSIELEDGAVIRADIWFRCHGVTPLSDSVGPALRHSVTPPGAIEVDEHLRVRGEHSVFAIGDVTAISEPKKSSAAHRHGDIVGANIAGLIAGEEPSAVYAPPPPAIIIPPGREGGAVQMFGDAGVEVLGPEVAASLKGADLMLGRWEQMFGVGGGEISARR